MSRLPKNILIVDNDNIRSLAIAGMVNKFGYNVFTASGEADFGRIVTGLIPHVVLVHIKMPKFSSGKTYFSAIKSSPGGGVIKIVEFGGKEDSSELKAAVTRGASASMIWPCGVTDFYALLQKLLESNPRRVPRIRLLVRAVVLTEREKKSYFATCISEYGVFIHTANPLKINTKVKLMLDLPSSRPFELSGHVIYGVARDPGKLTEPGMGIVFEQNKEMQLALRGFIESVFMAEHDTGLLV